MHNPLRLWSARSPSSASPSSAAAPGAARVEPLEPRQLLSTTDLTAAADAFVFGGSPTTNYGQQATALIRGAGSVSNTRKTYVRFETTASLDSPQQVTLTFRQKAVASDTSSYTVNVYGLIDGHAGEAWGETAIHWSNAPGNDTASTTGLDPAATTLLGQFVIPAGATADGTPRTLGGAAGSPIANFVAADADGKLTFILTRASGGSNLQEFYTREHTSPALAASLSVTTPDDPSTRRYPTNSGIINVVTAYGADPTGQSDSTAAIQQAISQNLGVSATLYFPEGTYRVSNTLSWKNTSGAWASKLTLLGESRDRTVIQLADHAAGFSSAIKPVVMTSAGNMAFGNYIRNLTIDTGRGNTMAVGIDYVGNNYASVEGVTIRSGDGAGYAGVALTRSAPGPALFQHVDITGFDYGVRVHGDTYATTFEHLTLRAQNIVGIRNFSNNLMLRNLASHNAVPVLWNLGSDGYVSIVQDAANPALTFTGGATNTVAIETNGTFFGRNLAASGYRALLREDGVDLPGLTLAQHTSAAPASLWTAPNDTLNLPIAETPDWHTNDLGQWVNVYDFGARIDQSDDAAAIQAAIDATLPGGARAGATVLYFPAHTSGSYRIAQPVIVRGSVRKIVGMQATLKPLDGGAFNDVVNNPQPLLRVEDTAHDTLIIEDLHLLQTAVNGDRASTSVLHVADDTAVVLKRAQASYEAAPGAADAFLHDIVGGRFILTAGQRVWARQLNPESSTGPMVINRGADLWVLGMKTEARPGGDANVTVLQNLDGARTEILGGYSYGTLTLAPSLPAFVSVDSSLSLSWANKGSAAALYQVQVRETRQGVTRELLRSTNGGHLPLFNARPAALATRLVADADAHIFGGSPNNNYGSAATMTVRGAGSVSNTRKAYVRFNTASLGAVADAQLILHQAATTDTAAHSFSVYGLRDQSPGENWSETGLTWSNAPGNDTASTTAPDLALTTLLGSFTAPAGATADGTPRVLSGAALTQFLSDDTDGRVTFIIVRTSGGTALQDFYSREAANPLFVPELYIG